MIDLSALFATLSPLMQVIVTVGLVAGGWALRHWGIIGPSTPAQPANPQTPAHPVLTELENLIAQFGSLQNVMAALQNLLQKLPQNPPAPPK